MIVHCIDFNYEYINIPTNHNYLEINRQLYELRLSGAKVSGGLSVLTVTNGITAGDVG